MPQPANALKTLTPFLGSRKKSNPFKVENRAEDKDVVVLLSLGAVRSSGLVSGDSRTGSSGL